jgi:hypothetical protein
MMGAIYVVLGAVGLLLWPLLLPSLPEPYQLVRRIEWERGRPFSPHALSLSSPVIFSGAVSHWPGLKRRPSEWAEACPGCAISGGKSETPVLMWPRPGIAPLAIRDDDPLARIPPVAVNVTRTEFSRALSSAPSSRAGGERYWYSSERVGSAAEAWGISASDLGEGSGHVWVGSFGATTHCHFDWSSNLHALVSGRKRFILFPPADSWALHVYSSLSSRATKSQVPLGTGGRPLAAHKDLFPEPIGQLSGQIADLQPGDVLYIPPVWLHHVVTTGEYSVSVNVWTPVADSAVEARLLGGVPAAALSSDDSLSAFAVSLVSNLGQDPSSFFKTMALSRYPRGCNHSEPETDQQASSATAAASEAGKVLARWLNAEHSNRERLLIFLADMIEKAAYEGRSIKSERDLCHFIKGISAKKKTETKR